MESELPLFSQHLNSGMNALARYAVLYLEINADGNSTEQIKEKIQNIKSLRDAMSNTENQLCEFKGTVVSLPRMTSVINHSKRAMADIIQRVVDELRKAQMLAQEAEATLKANP